MQILDIIVPISLALLDKNHLSFHMVISLQLKVDFFAILSVTIIIRLLIYHQMFDVIFYLLFIIYF